MRTDERKNRQSLCERACELFVRRGQRRDARSDLDIELPDLIEQALRRQAIRLGHQNVEADDGRVGTRDFANQPRKRRSGPRPLAQRRDALVVDCDDHRRKRDDVARRNPLIQIKPGRLQTDKRRGLMP